MKRNNRRERGAVALETALLLPLALAAVAALLCVGFYALVAGVVHNSAREAVRFASIPTTVDWDSPYPTESEIRERVLETMPGFIPDASVSVEMTTPSPQGMVEINVTVADVPVLNAVENLLSVAGLEGDLSITRSASARLE